MHGSILHGFKRFVVARDGADAWIGVVRAAKAGGWYMSTATYPDAELVSLVRATAEHERRELGHVLEEFGAALVPTLMSLYNAFVVPSWRTLELLMNVESVIHRTVRLRDPGASPPHLRTRRVSEHEVRVEYSSPRRLCALAIGICRGVGAHYGETITVDQPECMETGAPACQLVVRLASPEIPA